MVVGNSDDRWERLAGLWAGGGGRMSAAALTAELIRAANRVGQLGHFKRRRLLEDAAGAIAEMRKTMAFAGRLGELSERDLSFRLRLAALQLPRRADAEIAATFLEAAREMRALKIQLEDGTALPALAGAGAPA